MCRNYKKYIKTNIEKNIKIASIKNRVSHVTKTNGLKKPHNLTVRYQCRYSSRALRAGLLFEI